MTYQYITLRDKPEFKNKAAKWFHSKWKVPTDAYASCMEEYISGATELGWYLCLCGDKIVGGLGVIENDFHERTDLTPNVCAVYTEKAYRCQGIAGALLNKVVDDMHSHGINTLYLLTDHTSFYERYGWKFYGMVKENGGNYARMYIHE